MNCDACGEELDIINQSPRYLLLTCMTPGCRNAGRAAVASNLEYLEFLEETVYEMRSQTRAV